VDLERLADRQCVAGAGRGADGNAEVDRVGGAAASAGKAGRAVDEVVQESVVGNGQAVAGQDEVTEAAVAGEGDVVVAGIDLLVAAQVGVVRDGRGVGAAAQIQADVLADGQAADGDIVIGAAGGRQGQGTDDLGVGEVGGEPGVARLGNDGHQRVDRVVLEVEGLGAGSEVEHAAVDHVGGANAAGADVRRVGAALEVDLKGLLTRQEIQAQHARAVDGDVVVTVAAGYREEAANLRVVDDDLHAGVGRRAVEADGAAHVRVEELDDVGRAGAEFRHAAGDRDLKEGKLVPG